MVKYIFFPTGRQIWLDLAKSLYQSGVAKPVIWAGDPKLDSSALASIPELCLIDFFDVHTKTVEFELEFTDKEYNTFCSINSSSVRDKALKMMDRHDPYGAYRYVDRDAFFSFFITYSLFLLKKHTPDFLIMSESPHAPFQYVLYEVAKLMGVKSYSFVSWSIAPLAGFREGIDGPYIKLKNDIDDDVKKLVTARVDDFLDRFVAEDGDIEPEYIKIQKRKDQTTSSLLSFLRSGYSITKEMAKSVLRKPRSLERGVSDNTILKIFEPILKRMAISKRVRELDAALKGVVAINLVPDIKYVYFPLHYEPERTTNPDGLKYHDQLNVILLLRSWLPSNVAILVKEHYSQFTTALQGYKGRSPEFYRVLNNIKGVSLVSSNVESRDLIESSVMTCTITGTAALESALLGVPALAFGNPWFKGVPGVFNYSEGVDYSTFMVKVSASSWDASAIRSWLINLMDNNSLFMTINPSNEKYFSEYYKIPGLRDVELNGLKEAFLSMLTLRQTGNF